MDRDKRSAQVERLKVVETDAAPGRGDGATVRPSRSLLLPCRRSFRPEPGDASVGFAPAMLFPEARLESRIALLFAVADPVPYRREELGFERGQGGAYRKPFNA